MNRSSILRRGAVLLAGIACILSGCGSEQAAPTVQKTDFVPYDLPEFHDAVFHEEAAEDFGTVRVDSSCLEEGYVAVEAVSGSRLKFQVTCGEMKYNYDLSNEGEPGIFPLNMSDGAYSFRLMESVGDSKYACIWSDTKEITMLDEFQPYLRPSCMSDYNEESACVSLARQLAAECETDSDVASSVYAYLVKHIKYDHKKAASVEAGYVPCPDETLETGKGICFDYASLAAAMMRSVGIPCKLITGYVDNEVYHAWNCFYIREQGWVTVEIRATPNEWQRVDITFAAGGVDADELTNDGKYTTRFTY